MNTVLLKRLAMLGVLFALGCLATGCGQPAADNVSSAVSDASHDGHDHGGWWCVEHGVPEEDCSMCSSDAAAKFKEQGDWCVEHNRAESQCFICDSSRAQKFANLYEAKFGTRPPAREE